MDIFEADPDGGSLKQLTDTKGYDAEGSYSPDGKTIVFCSDRDGDPDVYLMNADGSNVRQLTNNPGYDGGPFISPDGQWVVYRSDRKKEGFLQIHVIGIDGKNDTALTDNVGVNWAPYWHPKLPYIIWTGADHSDPQARPNYDLWLMHYRAPRRPSGRGPDRADHRSRLGRRAAGVFARRHATDVDQQPHAGSRQPTVHRGFRAAPRIGILAANCEPAGVAVTPLGGQFAQRVVAAARTRANERLLRSGDPSHQSLSVQCACRSTASGLSFSDSYQTVSSDRSLNSTVLG